MIWTTQRTRLVLVMGLLGCALIAGGTPASLAAEAPQREEVWERVAQTPAETRLRLILRNGSKIAGTVVEVGVDTVTLSHVTLEKGSLFIPAGSSRDNLVMTFQRTDVLRVAGEPLRQQDVRVRIGKEVSVTGRDGSHRKGTLVSLSASDVVIRASRPPFGDVKLPLEQVHEVEGTSHALAYGAGIGIAAGVMAAFVYCQRDEGGCHPIEVESHSPLLIAGGVIGLGVGSAVGAMVRSSSRASRIIYKAPAKASVALGPAFGVASMGVAGRISW